MQGGVTEFIWIKYTEITQTCIYSGTEFHNRLGFSVITHFIMEKAQQQLHHFLTVN